MTEFKYDATVIIPTYNRTDLLSNTLDSLEKQETDYSFEVIICDDGSSEDTLSIVKKFSTNLEIKYYFQIDVGFRVSKARNSGIKLAEGKVIIFIDNGIIASSQFVNSHIKSHVKCKHLFSLGYVYGFDDYNIHEDILNNLINMNEIDGTIGQLEKNQVYDKREPLYNDLGDDLQKWPAPYVIAWSCNFSILAENIRQNDLFYDESYITYGGEDTDYAIQAYVKGLIINLNRDASTFHYPHQKNKVEIDENKLKNRTRKKRLYQKEKYKLDGTNIWPENQTFDVNRVLLRNKKIVIISDLDGTINKKPEKIDKIREKIKELKQKGIVNLFIINTGRNINSFQSAIKKYHLDFFDYAICSSGSIVIDKKFNVLFEKTLTKIQVQMIYTMLNDLQFVKLHTGLSLNNNMISDITLEFDNKEDGEVALEIFKNELKFENLTILLNGRFLDISHGDSDKWTASLDLISYLYNSEKVVTYSFGDGDNDADLLNKSDFSFSFNYADINARKTATFIVDDMEQGLNKIMQQLTLSNMKVYE